MVWGGLWTALILVLARSVRSNSLGTIKRKIDNAVDQTCAKNPPYDVIQSIDSTDGRSKIFRPYNLDISKAKATVDRFLKRSRTS